MTSDNSKRRRKIDIYHICRTGTGSSEWDYCSHDRHHTIYGEVCTPTLFLYQLLKGNKITNLWLLGAPRIWHPKCGNNVITLWNSELWFFPTTCLKSVFQSCYGGCGWAVAWGGLGESYNFCYTDSQENWDYCSPRYTLKRFFIKNNYFKKTVFCLWFSFPFRC